MLQTMLSAVINIVWRRR